MKILKPLVFAVSLGPLVFLVWDAFTRPPDMIYFNGMVRSTGYWSLRFLCMALAVTPVRWLTGWHWLVKFRRMLGLFGFFYGVVHTAAYVLFDRVFALDAAVRYAKQRKQFGQPISEFQAIQFKLADMATEVEAARMLVYQAAWLADQGSSRFTRESSMAKLFASEVAVRVANECVQIHGGYGFIKDYPAEKFYRDVKLCTIGEGTSEIQYEVIGRRIMEQS